MVAKREKTVLVRLGEHYLDPKNVAGVKHCKKGLYIIMLHSDPEPQYPLWLSAVEFEEAKQYFKIIGEI